MYAFVYVREKEYMDMCKKNTALRGPTTTRYPKYEALTNILNIYMMYVSLEIYNIRADIGACVCVVLVLC